jgi:hypothetical protein
MQEALYLTPLLQTSPPHKICFTLSQALQNSIYRFGQKNLSFWKATSHLSKMYRTWKYMHCYMENLSRLLRMIKVRCTNFLDQFNSQLLYESWFLLSFPLCFSLTTQQFSSGWGRKECVWVIIQVSIHGTHIKMKSRSGGSSGSSPLLLKTLRWM